MNILAVYFSHTGTTRQLVGEARPLLEARGCTVTPEQLRPEVDLPPPLWLLQSFVPGTRAPLRPLVHDPATFDACLLGLPKWTFACPPVNAFLGEHGRRLPPTAVAVTCGGWDQERYLEELVTRMAGMGIDVVAGIAVRRRDVESGAALGPIGALAERLCPGNPPGPRAPAQQRVETP